MLTADETQMLLRIEQGEAKKIDTIFVSRRIAHPTTPWGESLRLVRGILSHPERFDTVVIAKMMCAGVERAQHGLSPSDDGSLDTLTQWQSDPMTVPELKEYRAARAPYMPDLTSELLQNLISSHRIDATKLADVGLKTLPHLFSEGGIDSSELLHFEWLNNRLLKSDINRAEDIAQLAISIGNTKASEIPAQKNKAVESQYLFDSRYTATKIYIAANMNDRAREIVRDEAITTIEHKAILKGLYIDHLLRTGNNDKLPTYMSETNNLIGYANLTPGGTPTQTDRMRLNFGLALLRNSNIYHDSRYVEQARAWLMGLKALDNDLVVRLVNQFFGSKEDYINAIVSSNKQKDQPPGFLRYVISNLGANVPEQNFARALIEDTPKLIADLHIMKPGVEIAHVIATSYKKKEDAILKIFELARAMLYRKKYKGVTHELNMESDDILESMISRDSVRHLFGKEASYMDDEGYHKLLKLLRRSRRRTAELKALAETSNT